MRAVIGASGLHATIGNRVEKAELSEKKSRSKEGSQKRKRREAKTILGLATHACAEKEKKKARAEPKYRCPDCVRDKFHTWKEVEHHHQNAHKTVVLVRPWTCDELDCDYNTCSETTLITHCLKQHNVIRKKIPSESWAFGFLPIVTEPLNLDTSSSTVPATVMLTPTISTPQNIAVPSTTPATSSPQTITPPTASSTNPHAESSTPPLPLTKYWVCPNLVCVDGKKHKTLQANSHKAIAKHKLACPKSLGECTIPSVPH
jgi:hypothetical protein